MSYGRICAAWTLVLVTVLTLPAVGQSVISTRSGIVYFFEGTVYLGDQPLESHPGKFSSVPQGAELRTAKGRAEVLLTPGVFLRMGNRSTIRMIANELSDTRVELLAGSAIVDSAEPNPGTSVTLIYRNWSVRFLEQGVYRIDSDPPCLWVFQGKAEVVADNHKGALSVGQGMQVPLAPALVLQRSIERPRDALSTWAEGRQQSISADNAIAANIQDPGSTNISAAEIRAPASISTPSSGNSSVFSSRYTYLPLFLGLVAVGWKIYHNAFSTPPHRSFAASPSARFRSAPLFTHALPPSSRAGFVHSIQLFRPISAGQLRLGISLSPGSRVRLRRGGHR